MESTATAPAPAAAPAPEAMVTLKVNYDGTTRKCKLPLRDMGANTLEGKLRVFLDIGPSKDCLFERFSDSAGAYVELNPENTSVWKQLYRAAKAKSKLKLRVTNREPARAEPPPPEEHPLPAASTVIAEAATAISAATAAISAATAATTATAAASPKPATVEDEMESSTAQVIREIIKPLDDLADLRYSGSGRPLDSLASAPAPTPAPDAVAAAPSAPLDSQSEPEHGDVDSSLLLQSPHTAFAVSCNSCDQTIPNSHYHCVTCDDGDFDLCQACIDQGITCYGPSHWLIKRSQKDGQIVCSTTETIAPRRQPRTMFGPCVIKGAPPAGYDAKPDKTSPGLDEVKAQDEDERHRRHHQLYRRRHRHSLLLPILSSYDSSTTLAEARSSMGLRTCNNCVQDYPEHNFVHCTVCEDFDLCKSCFARDSHGHHPQHGFLRAVEGVVLPEHVAIKMRPGRNVLHNAICDGCDKFIAGVRHKCLDCPDWDYCSDCKVNAPFVHAQHRFVPIYEPLADADMVSARSVHFGICCDGPLCSSPDRAKLAGYIMGVRYKCAVCHDTDFCAACEASPSNTHNKTHPLIKFKTPVRHVSVTTHGENEEGRRMQPMGDRHGRSGTSSSCVNMHTAVNAGADADQVAAAATVINTISSTTEVATVFAPRIAMKSTQTVIDVKPAELAKDGVKDESKSESANAVNNKQPAADVAPVYEYPSYEATYVRETILDGTEFSPDDVFGQTWVLKNTGKTSWPAGCSVKFVGGDYMGNVNSSRPAGIVELASASESTICTYNLAPGEEFPFSVTLRAPPREGRAVSYWRLSSPAGIKFGDRLWCEILTITPPTETVVQQQPKLEAVVLPVVQLVKLVEAATATTSRSNQEEADVSAQKKQELPPQTMIFPKLEAESPRSSVHEAAKAEPTPAAPMAGPTGASLAAEDDDFEDCGDLGEWDGSDDGFQTDEEYDILDASDEEYLQQQMPKRK